MKPWKILKKIFKILLAIPLLFVVWRAFVRRVRRIYHFPMPAFMAEAIDNPLRRRLTPPEEMAIRHGLEPGMRVLEVGPGNGRFTVAAAQHLGPAGRLIAIDIQPEMLDRTHKRAVASGVNNLETHLEDVHHLPYDDESFDAVYMMTVIGEIPEPQRAIREFHRVLRPGGKLAFTEIWMDPDFVSLDELRRWVIPAGFHVKYQVGGWPVYTLGFEKGEIVPGYGDEQPVAPRAENGSQHRYGAL